MYIDCHVHCRDEEQRDKETIEHALSVAKDSGLDAIFDMPNTERPVTTRKRVLERFELARVADSSIFFGVYIGVTADKEQIKEAVETWKEFFPKSDSRYGVIGLKMFAGKSVGDLAIVEPEKQREVYNQLEKLNYRGVLAVHCEKESEMRPELWQADKPWTHSDARPEIAETDSIMDQITFSRETNYKGHLHILHVSTLLSVQIIDSSRAFRRISCGATPHHLLLSYEVMKGEDGILYRVNPPLRKTLSQLQLLDKFRQGYIDILESDHAPHTSKDKLEKYMSGIPNLASWPTFIRLLGEEGVEETLIRKVAFDNINKIFGTQIPWQDFNFSGENRTRDYVFDPYASLKK